MAAKDGAEAESVETDDAGPVVPVPQHTQHQRVGAIDVADIGLAEPSLLSALYLQHVLAQAQGESVLLMLTARRCRSCRGVDRALAHADMQAALGRVRLVRVDVDAFSEELAELNMPHSLYPAFLMLRPDLQPRDAIHAGEWGADVAENIAPVLGPFVRGTYRMRRHEWSPTAEAIRL